MIALLGVRIVQTKYEKEYIKFGLKVQYYRKLLGLTQEAFADKAGISWSYLANREPHESVRGVYGKAVCYCGCAGGSRSETV